MTNEQIKTVSSKEEAKEKRIELARESIEEGVKAWSKFAKVEGDEVVLYAQPFVVKKLTQAEKDAREAIKKANAERRAKDKAKRESVKAKNREEIDARKLANAKSRAAKLKLESEKAIALLAELQ